MVAMLAMPRLPTPNATRAPGGTREANWRSPSWRKTSPRTSGRERSGKCWRTGSMTGNGMFSGYSLALLAGRLWGLWARRPFVLMLFHPDASSVKDDAFGLQAEALFQAIFAGKRNFAAGADHAMPGQPARSAAQRPDHLSRTSGKTSRARHVAIGGHFAFRNSANGVADDFKHVASIARYQASVRRRPSSSEYWGRGPDRGGRRWCRPANREHRPAAEDHSSAPG